MNLTDIPLSNSLCYVAKQHAVDLVTNNPDTSTCNFHSWSDKGDWKACCYEKEIKDKSCMLDKPSEITGYKGAAYEIIYWENKQATPERAFDQWRETAVARAMITNFKEWESYSWGAIGISVYKGFAIAWLGEDNDQDTVTTICETGKKIEFKPAEKKEDSEIVKSATNRSYLIFGSFTSLEDAKVQLDKYHKEGFQKAKIVIKDDKFRISLSDYADSDQAAKAKKELPSKYKNAWILTY